MAPITAGVVKKKISRSGAAHTHCVHAKIPKRVALALPTHCNSTRCNRSGEVRILASFITDTTVIGGIFAVRREAKPDRVIFLLERRASNEVIF